MTVGDVIRKNILSIISLLVNGQIVSVTADCHDEPTLIPNISSLWVVSEAP